MDKEQEEQQKNKTSLEALEQALNEERKRSEECLTRLMYMQADFENLKKRFDRQVEEVRQHCNERLVVGLLDIADELEMALKSSRSSDKVEALTKGVEMTLKKLSNTLKVEGVIPIECVGKPFDPARHSVVAKVEKDGAEDCVIVEEVRKGYIMKGKVIRPSIVKIAVKPESKQQVEEHKDE